MNDPAISTTTIIARAADVIATDVEGDVVVMNVERGQCYAFDEIGTRIWSCLERPHRVEDLCALLLNEYDVDPTTCRRDVLRLLGELVREQLVVVADEEPR